jgi:hypothetical protein
MPPSSARPSSGPVSTSPRSLPAPYCIDRDPRKVDPSRFSPSLHLTQPFFRRLMYGPLVYSPLRLACHLPPLCTSLCPRTFFTRPRYLPAPSCIHNHTWYGPPLRSLPLSHRHPSADSLPPLYQHTTHYTVSSASPQVALDPHLNLRFRSRALVLRLLCFVFCLLACFTAAAFWSLGFGSKSRRMPQDVGCKQASSLILSLR